jgi:cobyrinic acid a,c-diamide synthase
LVRSFCIAGTHSGCGKTTVSLGIMAALKQRGLEVQPFKIGPDFIDPGHHRRVTGKDSHNLDGWMLSREYNEGIFSRNSRQADVVVAEGVMGLFDGFSGRDESGSTAQMAKWLHMPVFLVIDARSMARSAAALACGFAAFDPELPIAGVIFNRVAGTGHAEIIQEAMSASSELPVLGYLPREEGLEIPSRHLGLVIDEDYRMNEARIGRLGRWIESHLELDRLTALLEPKEISDTDPESLSAPVIKIGIAKDEAFSFYYPENLRLLRAAGAALVPFSPLRDRRLPEGINGLILGGGYPELHCEALSENRAVVSAIRDFGLNGGPIYAECGGFMFLAKEIRNLSGKAYPMVGLFSLAVEMEPRLGALGYRKIVTRKESPLGPAGTEVKGHEFHYSRIRQVERLPEMVYVMEDRKAETKKEEGFSRRNILGSYVHLHWGSNPQVARNFVEYCKRCI